MNLLLYPGAKSMLRWGFCGYTLSFITGRSPSLRRGCTAMQLILLCARQRELRRECLSTPDTHSPGRDVCCCLDAAVAYHMLPPCTQISYCLPTLVFVVRGRPMFTDITPLELVVIARLLTAVAWPVLLRHLCGDNLDCT